MKLQDEQKYTIHDSESHYGSSEWFGAMFFYSLQFGRVPFRAIHIRKYQRRNVWVGWFLQTLFALALFGGFAYASL